MVKKIYLHWTAGRYDQLFNDYHICIDGDGVVHKMADFETKLAHTWKRNSNAVGIALCCCYAASIARATLSEQRTENSGQKWENVPEKNSNNNDRNVLPSPISVASRPRLDSSLDCLNPAPCALRSDLLIDFGPYPPKEEQIQAMARCVAEICKEYGLPIRRDTVMTHAEVADIDGYGVYDDDPDLRWDLLRLPFAENISGGEYIRGLAKQMASELDIACGDIR